MRSLGLGVAACFLLGLAACSDDSDANGEATDAVSVDTAPATECRAAETPITPWTIGNEIKAVGTDATFYGLVFNHEPLPIRVGELKIVWRMTGEGEPTVTYWSPDGTPGELVFGPELHGGSNYDRPGGEWGTGYNFNEPGCWHIHLEREVGSGDAWIEVVD